MPPAIPGCALVEARVLAHDSTATGNVYVTVDPTASDTVFDGGFGQTDSDDGFQVKVLPFYGHFPDSAGARIVTFRPRSSRPVAQADTARAVLPFAEHGERPVPVTVRLGLPAPPEP